MTCYWDLHHYLGNFIYVTLIRPVILQVQIVNMATKKQLEEIVSISKKTNRLVKNIKLVEDKKKNKCLTRNIIPEYKCTGEIRM